MPVPRCAKSVFVLCAVCLLSLVSVFLFPISMGPYTASHGPATALKAIRSMQLILLSIALAGIHRGQRSAPPIQVGCVSYIPRRASSTLHPSFRFSPSLLKSSVLSTLPIRVSGTSAELDCAGWERAQCFVEFRHVSLSFQSDSDILLRVVLDDRFNTQRCTRDSLASAAGSSSRALYDCLRNGRRRSPNAGTARSRP